MKENSVKYYIPQVAQQNEDDLLAVFSFKYAAVNAGLGWIGKNDVLITEKYGPRVRLSTVLIDYHFETGTKIIESRCSSCNKCVDICPHKALKGKNWNINVLRNAQGTKRRFVRWMYFALRGIKNCKRRTEWKKNTVKF